jgi:tetratricopeptide (TPR) repeat protein
LEKLAADFPTAADYQNGVGMVLGNLARLSLARKDFALARKLLDNALPHHRAALKAHPQHAAYREAYFKNRWSLAAASIHLGDHAAAVDAANQMVEAAGDPAHDVYSAAGVWGYCVGVAQNDPTLSEDQRNELARKYGDRALDLLRQAVRNGYKDIEHMKKDNDLAPLRSREDFHKLLNELEAKSKG